MDLTISFIDLFFIRTSKGHLLEADLQGTSGMSRFPAFYWPSLFQENVVEDLEEAMDCRPSKQAILFKYDFFPDTVKETEACDP